MPFEVSSFDVKEQGWNRNITFQSNSSSVQTFQIQTQKTLNVITRSSQNNGIQMRPKTPCRFKNQTTILTVSLKIRLYQNQFNSIPSCFFSIPDSLDLLRFNEWGRAVMETQLTQLRQPGGHEYFFTAYYGQHEAAECSGLQSDIAGALMSVRA